MMRRLTVLLPAVALQVVAFGLGACAKEQPRQPDVLADIQRDVESKTTAGSLAPVFVGAGESASSGHLVTTSSAVTGDVSSATVLASGSRSARSLAARFGEIANVMDFGATGGGSINDAPAINAAISSGAPVVFFPPGIYRVSEPILLPTAAQATVTLLGTGSSIAGNLHDQALPATNVSTIKVDAYVNGIVASGGPTLGLQTYRIESLMIEGPDIAAPPHQTQTSANGIWIQTISRLIMRDVDVWGFRGPGQAGIRITNEGYYSSLHSVRSSYNDYGIYITGGAARAWNGNDIHNCQFRSNRIGAYILGAESLTVLASVFELNQQEGVIIDAGRNQTWLGNYFEANNQGGIGTYNVQLYGTSNGANAHIYFGQTHFSDPDHLVHIGGDAGFGSEDVRFVGAYANGATTPVALDATANNVLLDDFVASSRAPLYSGTGSNVIVRLNGASSSNPVRSTSQTLSGGNFSIDPASYSYFECVNGGGGIGFALASQGLKGQRITIKLVNFSGNPVAGVTYVNGTYGTWKAAAWDSLQNGYSRFTEFVFDGTYWQEVSRSKDIPT